VSARGAAGIVNAFSRSSTMNRKTAANPFWSTASFGDTADTSPMELSALGEHLDLCKESQGR
jgi:hypothetical protein